MLEKPDLLSTNWRFELPVWRQFTKEVVFPFKFRFSLDSLSDIISSFPWKYGEDMYVTHLL